MTEIRFHGRGGQGTVLAAKILAEAVLRFGKGECLAMPEFGVERRGAPVAAYARVAEGKIRLRTRVYEPDVVVILDPTLGGGVELIKGLKPGGLVVINTDQTPAQAARLFPSARVVCVPARRIALSHRLGSSASPVVNTAVCGALLAATGLADRAALEAAIRASVPEKSEENVAAAREAFELCAQRAHAQA